MKFYVTFPDNESRKNEEFSNNQDAIQAGLKLADEATVEVYSSQEGDEKNNILLARYEKRT